MESAFGTVTSQLGDHFGSYGIAKEPLFDYIEALSGQQRRPSSLGSISPAD